MEKELKDRLHDAQVCSPAQNYCRNRHVMEEAANRIEVLEEKLKAAVDDAKEAEDYAEELEAKLAKTVDYMSQAHVVMRACGWQNALEHQAQGDGVLELAAVEVEEKFGMAIAELTGGQNGSKT